MLIVVGRRILNSQRIESIEIGGDGVVRVVMQSTHVEYLEGEDAVLLLAHLLPIIYRPSPSVEQMQRAQALLDKYTDRSYAELIAEED